MWEADLADLKNLSNYNKSFKYILTIIDAFSKYLFAVPLKTKKPLEIIKAFKDIFVIRKPTKLRTDRGLEFENKDFKTFCNKNDVIFFTTTNSTIKCAIVERVQRTIKSKMFRILTNSLNKKWIDILPNIVKSYNNSIHRSTKYAPSDVNYNNESEVCYNLYGTTKFTNLLQKESKLHVGDNVRIKYDLKPFDKSFYPMWSDTVYTIKTIFKKYSNPLYELLMNGETLKRKFYQKELQKVNVDDNTLWRVERIIRYRITNGQREALVKWVGYPNKHNIWIPVNQIQKF
jgi:hypothetical protein